MELFRIGSDDPTLTSDVEYSDTGIWWEVGWVVLVLHDGAGGAGEAVCVRGKLGRVLELARYLLPRPQRGKYPDRHLQALGVHF